MTEKNYAYATKLLVERRDDLAQGIRVHEAKVNSAKAALTEAQQYLDSLREQRNSVSALLRFTGYPVDD